MKSIGYKFSRCFYWNSFSESFRIINLWKKIKERKMMQMRFLILYWVNKIMVHSNVFSIAANLHIFSICIHMKRKRFSRATISTTWISYNPYWDHLFIYTKLFDLWSCYGFLTFLQLCGNFLTEMFCTVLKKMLDIDMKLPKNC